MSQQTKATIQDLPHATKHALGMRNIDTIEKLAERTEVRLLTYKGIGPAAITHIDLLLQQHGTTLLGKSPEELEKAAHKQRVEAAYDEGVHMNQKRK